MHPEIKLQRSEFEMNAVAARQCERAGLVIKFTQFRQATDGDYVVPTRAIVYGSEADVRKALDEQRDA